NQRKSKSCCGPAVIVQNGQKKISDGSQPRLTLCLSLSESAGSRSLDRLVRHSDHRKERLSGLDSLALERADFYPPNSRRMGRPDHCLLSLGQSVLRAPAPEAPLTMPLCALWLSSGCASSGAAGRNDNRTTKNNFSDNWKSVAHPSPLARANSP